MPSYLTEKSGKPSSMRLMSMLALVVSAGLALIEVFEWGSAEVRPSSSSTSSWRRSPRRQCRDSPRIVPGIPLSPFRLLHCHRRNENEAFVRPQWSRRMRSTVAVGVVVVVAALSTPVDAQELHADLCLHGCPSGGPITNDIVIRDIYVLSSNDATKFADWVAYRVTASTIGPTAERVWKSDPWLAEGVTLEPNDYRGAFAALNTDRGHQAPLASFTSTEHWETTNYLSNITPQKSALNRGPWLRLEEAVRKLARAVPGAVYVITDPLHERGMPPPAGGVRKPSSPQRVLEDHRHGDCRRRQDHSFRFGDYIPNLTRG